LTFEQQVDIVRTLRMPVAVGYFHVVFTKNAFLFINIKVNFYSKTNQMHTCIKFILLGNDILYVSECLSVHHQEFKTVHPAVSV